MKTAELLDELKAGRWVRFETKRVGARIALRIDGPDAVRLYVGDEYAEMDYQYLKADDLRELAKKLKAIAASIDPEV